MENQQEVLSNQILSSASNSNASTISTQNEGGHNEQVTMVNLKEMTSKERSEKEADPDWKVTGCSDLSESDCSIVEETEDAEGEQYIKAFSPLESGSKKKSKEKKDKTVSGRIVRQMFDNISPQNKEMAAFVVAALKHTKAGIYQSNRQQNRRQYKILRKMKAIEGRLCTLEANAVSKEPMTPTGKDVRTQQRRELHIPFQSVSDIERIENSEDLKNTFQQYVDNFVSSAQFVPSFASLFANKLLQNMYFTK